MCLWAFHAAEQQIAEGEAAEELSSWPRDGVLTSNDNQRQGRQIPFLLQGLPAVSWVDFKR